MTSTCPLFLTGYMCFKNCKVEKSHLKQNTRTQDYLSISTNQNPTNCWTIHGYISLFPVILLPLLGHSIPLCCFLRISFGSFVSLGWFLSMDLECSPRISKALGTESRSPCGEQLAIGGRSTSSQAWGGVPRWSYPVPGRNIHFLESDCLSDHEIRLRQSLGRSPLVYSRAIALGSPCIESAWPASSTV